MAIKSMRAGKHTLVAAETGSGKTLAFVLPVLEALTAGRQGALPAAATRPREASAPRPVQRY